jgi:hypothetical protein
VMPKPKLLQSLRANLRLRHFSPRTEEAYSGWVRRYVRFHRLRHPADLGEAEVKAFLTHLAVDRQLAPSTLAQALAALLFLYREVVGRSWDTAPRRHSAGMHPRTPRCGTESGASGLRHCEESSTRRGRSGPYPATFAPATPVAAFF